MPMGVLFWVLMVIWLLAGYLAPPTLAWAPPLLLFLLLFLLGWKVFGFIIQ